MFKTYLSKYKCILTLLNMLLHLETLTLNSFIFSHWTSDCLNVYKIKFSLFSLIQDTGIFQPCFPQTFIEWKKSDMYKRNMNNILSITNFSTFLMVFIRIAFALIIRGWFWYEVFNWWPDVGMLYWNNFPIL